MHPLKSLLLAAGVAFFATASNAQMDAIPNLLGEWRCDEAATVFRDGEWSSVARTIDVIEQREALFLAINHWAVPEEVGVSGHQDGRASFAGTHTWLGVIGFDNQTFRITSQDDGHIVQGWIIDDRTIGISAMEPGENAWVSRSICTRGEGG